MVTESSQITVSEISFECILGTYSFERESPQRVLLSFTLWLDFSPSAKTENLQDTVNYAALTEDIKQFIIRSQFFLVETLVTAVAERVLNYSPLIQKTEISVSKPNAIPEAERVTATIRVSR